MGVVELDGLSLTTATWGDGSPELVMLHDGLGSITQWGTLPERLHRELSMTVLAYDRAGHGASRPRAGGAWPSDWMHTEARRLGRLLDASAAGAPLLVGHSDGASIALLHAADRPRDVAAVVALAPHSHVEVVCVAAISGMRRHRAPLVAALARHHEDPSGLFDAWSGAWVSAGFASWDIRARLGEIIVPVLVVQGDADEYATPAMLTDTAAAIGPACDARLLPGLGHLLHREAPDTIVELVASFVSGSARPMRS